MSAYDDVLTDCPAVAVPSPTDNQGNPVRPATESFQEARRQLFAERETA